METLGQYLKRERELRDISLEEISRHTKYHLSNLKSLEADQHDLLPSPPYVKGMLRSISKFLGLDVTDVLLRYEDLLNSQEKKEPEQKMVLPRIPFYKQRNFLTVTATSLFVILSISVFIFFRESRKLEPIVDVQMPTGEKSEEVVKEAPTRTSKLHLLSIQATKLIWVKSQIDSEKPTSFNMKPGQNVQLEAKKKIRFFVSDASGLKLVFNGAEVEGREGPQVITFP